MRDRMMMARSSACGQCDDDKKIKRRRTFARGGRSVMRPIDTRLIERPRCEITSVCARAIDFDASSSFFSARCTSFRRVGWGNCPVRLRSAHVPPPPEWLGTFERIELADADASIVAERRCVAMARLLLSADDESREDSRASGTRDALTVVVGDVPLFQV